MKVADFVHGRDNNFNLMRVVAASAVLLSHCWPLALGSNDGEPLARVVGVTMGTSAVIVFFALSGFLVASSWDRWQSPIVFAGARALRIFPGLFVALVIDAFVIGAAMTTLGSADYLSSPGTWTYVPTNLLLVKAQLTTPGVFENLHYKVLNGPLWTLAYEVFCYVLLFAAGWLGLLRRERFPYAFAMFAAAWLIVGWLGRGEAQGFAHHMVVLGGAFLTGVTMWVWRRHISLSGPLATVLLAAGVLGLIWAVPGSVVFFPVALAYLTLYLALVPNGWFRQYNRVGDVSYGVYIYGWPMQQVVLSTFPGIGVASLFFLALAVTLLFATASWMLVEHPAMRFGRSLAMRLTGRQDTPSPVKSSP
jgi:peptidoglycan/LPS O-acetylase OafA/YrhL